MEANAFLKDWITTLIKHRDVLKNSIQSIEDSNNNDFIVNYKEENAYFLVRGVVDEVDELVKFLHSNTDKVTNLILINEKKNFEFLLENWKVLAEFNQLSVYFINPFSNTDRYWVIRPYVHNRICDESNLKAGLKAMFDSVDKTNEKIIASKAKGL